LLEADGHAARAYDSVDSFIAGQGDPEAGCLLLDVRLPGVNGFDFLSRMLDLGIRLPVILITGYGDIPMSVRGMRAGAIDFLTKPFGPSEVLEAVSRALAVDRDRRLAEIEQLDVMSRYGSLSPRERQVMALVTAGKMNKQAAGELGLSEITIKVHRGTLMRKMGVRTLADLVKMAEQIHPTPRRVGTGTQSYN
jgi:FixJ family two-component response regulator